MILSKAGKIYSCIAYHKLKTVYHSIPKVACTTVNAVLWEIEYGDQPSLKDDIMNIHLLMGKTPAMGVNTFNDYFHFTIVRNPYSRFISFYKDKILNGDSLRFNQPERDLDKTIDFVCNTGDNFDTHIAAQMSLIYSNKCKAYKIETLDQDWVEISKNINIIYKPLMKHNASPSVDVVLSDEQKEKIYTRYEMDFVNFGYDK